MSNAGGHRSNFGHLIFSGMSLIASRLTLFGLVIESARIIFTLPNLPVMRHNSEWK